jgi:multiple sugar transport system permease protein
MPAIALMSIWWGAGGNMLVYLAGLKAIPRELLEAAEIDGATPLQRFKSVTWPLLKPTTLFCLVMSVISSSQVFGQTYILTGGGPYYSTLTVMLYMYQQGFGLYQLGYACAVAYVLFVAVFIFTLIQFKLLEVRQ